MNANQSNSSRFLHALIDKFPGLYFREISRASDFSVGSLDYNLRKLKKSNLIVDDSIWNKKRYFSNFIYPDERKLIGILREENIREIIELIQRDESINNSKISHNLNLSKPTINWYIKRLKIEGILDSGDKIVLKNRDMVNQVLLKYKSAFSDKMLNNLISMWEL